MAKLIEKTGAELFASLVNIAEPIGNLVKDEKLFQTFVDCTARGTRIPETARKNQLAFIMNLYSEMIPLVFSDEHIKDIMAILSEIEGKPIKSMLAMNGADLVSDVIAAWGEQLAPFVKRSGLMALIESSSR